MLKTQFNLLKTKLSLLRASKRLVELGLEDLTFGHLSIKVGSSFTIKRVDKGFSNSNLFNLETYDSWWNSDIPREYYIHRDLYSSKSVNCVLHVHSPNICALAASPAGVLNISQYASLVRHSYLEIPFENSLKVVSYDYETINKILEHKFILQRHHGFLTHGASVEEVLFNAYLFESAAKIQMLAKNSIARDYTPAEAIISKKLYRDYVRGLPKC